MADIVASVLQKAAENEAKFQTTDVSKDIDLELDEGNLLAVDVNPLNAKAMRLMLKTNLLSNREEYLRELARGNTQLLLNSIWNLPTERVEDSIVAELPDAKTILPREKPIPQKDKLTKWQEYAKLKGIQKTKKSRKIWDDNLKEWRPRWGYKSTKNEKDWVLEVPQNADIYEDQFEKKSKEKKERIAKNELQRLRNIARRMKGKVPGVGLTPTDAPDKDHLQHALSAARASDASLGRFSQRVSKEEKYSAKSGKKRKFEPNIGNTDDEKKRSLKILSSVTGGQPVLNVQKAVGQHLSQEERRRTSVKNKGEKKGGKKGGKGGPKKSPYAGKSGQFKQGGRGGGKGGQFKQGGRGGGKGRGKRKT